MKTFLKTLEITFSVIAVLMIAAYSYYVYRVLHPEDFLYPLPSDIIEYEGLDYLNFYRTYMGEDELDDFLIRLTEKGNDAQMLNLVSYYSFEKNRCAVLPSLMSRVVEIEAYPQDTVWDSYMGNGYTRGSNIDMLQGNRKFFENVKKLRSNCKD